MKLVATMFSLFFVRTLALAAEVPLPTGDKPGSGDNPLLKRFEGSIILSYETKSADDVSWPLSKLEWVRGKKNSGNNDVAAPKKTKNAEGERTTILYVAPPARSSLEVLRSYKDQVSQQKGKVLFECKGADCGGKDTGNSLDGGSRMGLAMYLRSADQVKEQPWSIPWCAAHVALTDVRYLLAEIPASRATLSVMTASPSDPGGNCKALAGHAIALVDIVTASGAKKN